MSAKRLELEDLLNRNENDAAIERLCVEKAPDRGWQYALLARAYFQRGDSRGDLFAGDFFAARAANAGFDEPWLDELLNKHLATTRRAEEEVRRLRYEMGGVAEPRTAGRPTPYRFNANSVQAGTGTEPRDFAWSARNVPCQAACPAGTDIPEYLTAVFAGNHLLAYRINLESNVFPGVLGRVCARPCEEACRHGWNGLGESVAICFSKRAAADLRNRQPIVVDRHFANSGRSVAVVGAGVGGLTAARELARCGHDVTVFEKHHRPGGMLNQGIPEFRLPREVIDHEIEQIRLLGVRIECGVAVGPNRPLAQLVAEFDAVVLAAGTMRPNILDLPGKELAGVRHGLEFLLQVNETGHTDLGRNVVVVGGGFTAMDCARTAKRLGPETVKVWYRRTQGEMLITPGELEELEHESIDIEYLVSPVRYIGEAGHVTAIEFIRTELGEPDHSGRRRPVPVAGSEFQVPADAVLLATGQFPDTGWIDEALRVDVVADDGWPHSDALHATGVPGIFVAGDFGQGATSLISAIGHAKWTARQVDSYLVGHERLMDRVRITDADETGRIREMDAVPLQPMPVLPVEQRDLKGEVEIGYGPDLAVDETQRCYRCHYKYEIDPDKCIYCDWCVKAKPRPECILKVRKLHYDEEGRVVGWEEATGSDDTYLVWINQYDCIRCGACVDACPVDAIGLQKVSLETGVPCTPGGKGCRNSHE